MDQFSSDLAILRLTNRKVMLWTVIFNMINLEAESFDLSAISSMGFPLNDFDNPSFVFGSGDIIDVEWNVD